jgi:subtilisin family serine protease
MDVAQPRTLWLAVLCACVSSWGFEIGQPYWLRACDKRDAGGRIVAKGAPEWEPAPVRIDLQDSLVRRGWKVRGTLRWANLISAEPVVAQADLPTCLTEESPVARAMRPAVPEPVVAARGTSVDPAQVTLLRMHEALGVAAMRKAIEVQYGQLPGAGMRVAVIDDGFIRQHRVLEDADIVDAWDFVSGDSLPWDEGAGPWLFDHGTATAGLVASRWDVVLPGIAPRAQLLLYRAEDDDRETSLEEDFLAMAIERAWEKGAKVASISLGYRYFFDDGSPNHPFASMDGKTLVASRTAARAASKDLLVVVAMGNEGGMGDRSLGSPADADSILSVGAISEGGLLCGFSSTGPAADGRIKPELVAYGCTVPVASGISEDAYSAGGAGTSYATPLVAGMALLVRQYRPDWGPMQVRSALMGSADNASSPNSQFGWGLPDLRKLLGRMLTAPKVYRHLGDLGLVLEGNLYERLDFALYTRSGRLVHRGRKEANVPKLMDLGPVSPGVYLLRWSTSERQGSQVVVIPTR